MAIEATEKTIFGGVDARSNPLAYPKDRSLYCSNWVPNEAGYLELRSGYSQLAMPVSLAASAINSLVPFSKFDGTSSVNYLIAQQGSSLNAIATATGVKAALSVPGGLATGKLSYALANGKLHLVNGTDAIWTDGTTVRRMGIRGLTDADIRSVVVAEGLVELTSTMRAAITLTAASSGSFPVSANGGHLVYVARFQTDTNELGPATQIVGTGRVLATASSKISVAVIPADGPSTQVKLMGITGDGGTFAGFCTLTSKAITSAARASSTVTVLSTAHGLTTGDVVIMSGQTEDWYNDVYCVTVVDANHFTYAASRGAASTGGTVKKVLAISNTTTTVDILAPANDQTVAINADRGIPATSVGGAQPGYQFYLAIANPDGGGDYGNAIKVGARFAPAVRCNVAFSGLPALHSENSEWQLAIGRTGDGAEVAHACTDSAGNFVIAPDILDTYQLRESSIDGAYEMPSRNEPPPALSKLWKVGDYLFGAMEGSPYVYRSLSEADSVTGGFLGRPEHCWPRNNVETFPTGHNVTCGAGFENEAWVFTLDDLAILSDMGGVAGWRGPWNVGCAGQRAWVKAGSWGPFWVTGDKQLATMKDGSPVPVSGEYEQGLLAKIGDAYLKDVEIVYMRDIDKNLDQIRIEARKADGTKFYIIHDFALRDATSIYGQAYEGKYLGVLANNYTVTLARDGNDHLQVFAGASDGTINKLYSGDGDLTADFDADYVMLVNGGPNRPAMPWIAWYGDSNLVVSVAKKLNTTLASGWQTLKTEEMPGAEGMSFYRVKLDAPEFRQMYVRLQLKAHHADHGAQGEIPGLPVDQYGKVYMMMPAVKAGRGPA